MEAQEDREQDRLVLIAHRDAAVRTIQQVLDTPPRQRHQIVDFGECAIVALRDRLIANLRALPAEGSPAEQLAIRARLEQVNMALSLITGVVYPGTGIQEESLEQVRDVLTKVIY